MLETPLRQAATVLLESAIRIAPPDAREWGRAMRAELSYVEGPWPGVLWALGGARVMAKHALVSLLIPGRRQNMILDGGLFAKRISLRKVALAAGVAYVLAALIFFAAPPFRQGLRVSLAPWKCLVSPLTELPGQAGLRALAKQAEARHDPEGMAFVAARLVRADESARLAEQAVRLDPNLFWVYAVVAVRHPDLGGVPQWIAKLERSEPGNALWPLITAQSNDIDHASRASRWSPDEKPQALEGDPAWQKAMAAAFASPRFDDYLDRLRALDSRVVRRYGFNEPDVVLFGGDADVSTYVSRDTEEFAKSLVVAGQELEARGDREGALEKYWAVASFGQVIDSQAHSDSEHWMGARLQARAYKQLQALSAQEGNAREAALFSYLAGKFEHAPRANESAGLAFGRDISRRNAAVLEVAGLAMLAFAALFVIAVLTLIAGRHHAAHTPEHTKPVATVATLASGMGLLLSCATLYLTYRPYWYIFQHAILNGDSSQTRDLRDLLAATQFPAFALPGRNPYWNLPVYFWTGVIVLGSVTLLLILLRHLVGRPHSGGLQHNPRVP